MSVKRWFWCGLACLSLSGGAGAGPLFVEGNGTRGITLDYFATPASRIEVDFALTAARPVQMRVFGADLDYGDLNASCYVNGAGEFSFGAGDKFTGHATGYAADTLRHVAVLDFVAKRGQILTDGKVSAERKITVPCTRKATHPLCLMARPLTTTGRTYGGCAKVRIYGAKIYENGKLVRDFAPTIEKGVPGFRDRLSGFFAENGWRVPHWFPILTEPGALTDAEGHVQGMCQTRDALYLTMMSGIAKTDWRGRLIKKVMQPVKSVHTGDICADKGRLYAAICCFQNGPFIGKDAQTGKPNRGCLQMWDEDLNLLKSRPILRPPDGIVCLDGVLYVGLGSSFYDKKRPYRGTYFGKYDSETLEPLGEPFLVDSGYDAWAGVQNLTTDGTFIYANFYVPDETAHTPNFIKYDRDFKVMGAYEFGYGQGVDFVPGGRDGARRFLCCETVNWLMPRAAADGLGLYGFLTFHELKDGKISDLSVRNGYRVRRERW